MDKLVIIGASGHGKVIAELAKKAGYTTIVFLDDNVSIKVCGEYKVAGNCQCAMQYKDSDFIVAIGNAEIRRKIQIQLMKENLHMVSLIHPDAVIAENVEIGTGTVVMAGAVINPYVKIGQGCIINTCASVDHDCVIGDFVHISVGSHIAGTVAVGNNTWIGAGATVSNNVKITGDCIIGAGTVVIKNIEEPDIYIGVPARRMEKMKKINQNLESRGVRPTTGNTKRSTKCASVCSVERRAA